MNINQRSLAVSLQKLSSGKLSALNCSGDNRKGHKMTQTTPYKTCILKAVQERISHKVIMSVFLVSVTID